MNPISVSRAQGAEKPAVLMTGVAAAAQFNHAATNLANVDRLDLQLNRTESALRVAENRLGRLGAEHLRSGYRGSPLEGQVRAQVRDVHALEREAQLLNRRMDRLGDRDFRAPRQALGAVASAASTAAFALHGLSAYGSFAAGRPVAGVMHVSAAAGHALFAGAAFGGRLATAGRIGLAIATVSGMASFFVDR